MHYSWTHKFHFSATFSLKSGPTVLFTYLKIILLQYFLVFSFQLYPNGPLISPFVSVFIRMTDTWQVKDPRAKKNSHLFIPPTSLSKAISDFLSICLSLSHVSFFSSLSLALLSLSLKQLLEPFSQFPFSLQNYSPYLFRSVITFCFFFFVVGWVLRDFGSNGDESVVWASLIHDGSSRILMLL